MNRRARRAAGAATLLALAALVRQPIRAVAATPAITRDSTPSRLTLASQTSWVDPTKNSIFNLRVAVDTSSPATDVQFVVDVYSKLTSRSDFARTLSDGFTGYVISQPIGAPLSTLHPDAQGVVDINIPIAGSVRDPANFLHLPGSGVYPVSAELRPRGGGKPLARLVTTMLYTSGPITGPPLHVVWVAPVHAAVPDPRSAGSVLPGDDTRLTTLVSALAAHPTVQASLQVTPDTIAGLDRADPTLVSRLGRTLDGRQVLAQTWVPTSLPAMLQAGLDTQVSVSLARATDRLSTDLGTDVAGRSWVQDGPVDRDTLSFLRGHQFDRVVLPETDLDPNPSRFTLAQPFQVAGSDQIVIRAAVADAGVQAHFSNGGDQVLAAHQLLGDLAQIYADTPANNRGLVVVTPRVWQATAPFLDVWLSGLESSPLLSSMDLDSFFDQIPPIPGHRRRALIRQITVDDAAIRANTTDLLADQQLRERAKLDALATAIPVTSVVYQRLDRLFLEAPSSELSATARRQHLDALDAGILDETRLVVLAGPRSITLTARTGRLPLNIVSQSDDPVSVTLRVESDKLVFPGVTTTGSVKIDNVLHKGNNPVDVAVRARTSGAFPVRVTVLTKNEALVITQAKFTIQSTALSGVGVFLSVGAALFLLVWWGRHAWRTGRRGAHTSGADRLPATAPRSP